MVLNSRQVNVISPLRICSLSVAMAAALTLILGFQMLPRSYTFVEGNVSSQTIKSPVRATFTSTALTEVKREEAAARVPGVQVYHAEIDREQLRKLGQVLARITQIRDGADLATVEQKAQALGQLGDVHLSQKTIDSLLQFSGTEWRALGAVATRLLREVMGERVTDSQLAAVRASLGERMDANLTPDQAQALSNIVAAFITPNMLVDQAETEKARLAAMNGTEPVVLTVEPGETILRDGQVIEKIHLEKLDAVGLLNRQLEWENIFGVGLFALILTLLCAGYLYFFQPRSLGNTRRLFLLFIIIVGTVLAAKLTIPGRPLWAHLFPVAAAPMLLAALLDAHIGIISAAVLALLVSYVGGFTPDMMAFGSSGFLSSIEPVMTYFVGGVVGLLWIWRAERLSRFFIAGAAVAGVTFLITAAFWLMAPERELAQLGWYAAVSAGAGILASSLTVGISLLLSLIFGITTSFHLLELAQPNHPLLRRLMMEAPGTYHHSIITGNLAERGAEAIDANLLLVRVGAYYHDIGKVLRPWAFSENQLLGDNIHDRLEPVTSASIVTAHVSDGLRLAEKYHLPSKVKDFIAEHHGTRVAPYFYQQAKERGENVDESIYRYPGPRPQSKETAIVMLADSIEATARSCGSRTPEEIDELVDRVISDRLQEGQLAESDLTLRDIELLRAAFKSTLKGIFHPRIEYPPAPPILENKADKEVAK